MGVVGGGIGGLSGALPPDRVHPQHRLTGVADHGDRVEARFSGDRRVEVDALVGADGIHSTVRGILFGPEDPTSRAARPTAAWCRRSVCAGWTWR